MTDTEKSNSKISLAKWVKTGGVGAVIAALLSAWQFYFKEIIIPKSVPINITLNLQLKKVDNNSSKSRSSAGTEDCIEIKMTASNPSQRTIYILPNEWIAYAYSKQKGNNNTYIQEGIKEINDQEGQFEEKYHIPGQYEIVALGSILNDVALNPGETVNKNLIFHIPSGKFESLEVSTNIISVSKEKKIQVEWNIDTDGEPSLTIYRLDKKGKRTGEIKPNKDGSYVDKDSELQYFSSSAMVKL